jgi:hypothetical protein
MNDPDSIPFEITCPMGHKTAVRYKREELAAKLEDGTLRFWCGTCIPDFTWEPGDEEKQNIKKWMRMQS